LRARERRALPLLVYGDKRQASRAEGVVDIGAKMFEQRRQAAFAMF